MQLHSGVAEQIELEDEIFSKDTVSEGMHIEEILQRAHEIHRARGGLIGYDLEDWQQAERELIGEFSQSLNGLKQQSSEPGSVEIRTPCQDHSARL